MTRENQQARWNNERREDASFCASLWLSGFLWLLSAHSLCAQSPILLPKGIENQILIQQPPVEISTNGNVSITAEFDPPLAAVGQKVFYRVNVGASQSFIDWPKKISAPPELKWGVNARGQLTQPDGTRSEPQSVFAYEVVPMKPGRYTVPPFTVEVEGKLVEVPNASLMVAETGAATPSARRLVLEFSKTNVFAGQPIMMRVVSPMTPNNPSDALRDVQFNGGEIFTDKLSIRIRTGSVTNDGQVLSAFIYEATVIPLGIGAQEVSVQAFTTSLFSGGPVRLLTSEPIRLNVRSLPADQELAGFTGAMGKFTPEKPFLSTNRVHVGEPVKLRYSFATGTNLTRFVPPSAPSAREWQIIAGKFDENAFTLIPLTDEVSNTPKIPFCAFDFNVGKFYDLTIPEQPIVVTGDGLPTQLSDWDEKSAPLRLSGLAAVPGRSVASLRPLQLQGWFVLLQLLPVAAFIALWRWYQHRRFLEAHPEIARRRGALRALRRKKIELRAAWRAGDLERFNQCATDALRIAVAPHFPAEAEALVGSDVLAHLTEAECSGIEGETVRNIFAMADTRFADMKSEQANADEDFWARVGRMGREHRHNIKTKKSIAVDPKNVERVLEILEARL